MDVEHAIISEIVLGEEMGAAAEFKLTPAFFTDPDHRAVYELIQDHWLTHGKVPGESAVHAAYPRYEFGEYEEPLGFYVELLRDQHMHRLLLDGLQESEELIEALQGKGPNPGRRAFDQLTELLIKARMEVPVGRDEDLLAKARREIMGVLDDRKMGGLRGITTGFEELDLATGGFQPEQLITLIGLPGTGKSSMLLRLALTAVQNGTRIIFVTFEMSNEEMMDRAVSLVSGVDLNKILSGQVTIRERKQIEESLARMEGLDGFFRSIYDRSSMTTLSGLQAKILEYQPKAVFVDGTYMMEDETGEPMGSPRAITNITRGMKRLAQNRKIPIINSTQALIQKSKGGVTMHSAGYCVDEETEILTEDGWRFQHELEGSERVLTLNHETGQGEWHQLRAVHRFDPQPRQMMAMEGKNHSSLSTLGHRWPVVSPQRWGTERRWVTSETFKGNDYIVTAAPCSDQPVDAVHDDALVELLAWFWTEGGIRPNGGVVITQSQKNQSNVDRIRACLEKVLGPEHDGPPVYGRSDGVPRWSVKVRNNRPLVEFCLNKAAGALLLGHAPDRVVDYSFLRELTHDQLRLFLWVSLEADRCGLRSLAQKDRRRTEAFIYAATLCGVAANLSLRPPTSSTRYPMWKANLSTRSVVSPVASARQPNKGGFRMEVVDFNGMVWCPEVQNSSWLARRNGKVYFTGNSSSFAQDSDVILTVEQCPDPNKDVSKFRADKVRNGPKTETYVRMDWHRGVIERVDPALIGLVDDTGDEEQLEL